MHNQLAPRFVLAHNAREIPSGQIPIARRHHSFNELIGSGTSSLGPPSPTELEVALLGVFESIGLPFPTQSENLISRISTLSKYIRTLVDTVDRERAARTKAEATLAEEREKAEATLAEERANHARLLQEIRKECQEPFVVPALLDAFIALSETVDSISRVTDKTS
ncbi:hypothetical protein B0F90DRAFT_1817610 [Multifurca ochricompacta]|uniref:Uncharacterized protein n=1 Tax=Multifurca ochricompacta TaxID=376703 RepID=A0AAD4M406_9AGAM|nr:hypothetical protein B0F90DRAFT_1817610 [Multifurca ochricompacta]